MTGSSLAQVHECLKTYAPISPSKHLTVNAQSTLGQVQGVSSVSLAKRQRGIAHEEDDEAMGTEGCLAWDDVTGAALDPVVVRRARLEETEFSHRKGVYTKVSRTDAIRRGIRFLRQGGLMSTRATRSTSITRVVSPPWSSIRTGLMASLRRPLRSKH